MQVSLKIEVAEKLGVAQAQYARWKTEGGIQKMKQ